MVSRERSLLSSAGPGGSGKTRLAGEVARRVAGRFADGAWLAELAAVRDPAQVPVAVAVSLGCPPGAARPGLSQLGCTPVAAGG